MPSAPENMHKRRVIRETWGDMEYNSKYGSFRVLFLLGRTDDQLFKNHISREMDQYQDIVQGSFTDTYDNLSYKHVMGLKWFRYYCPKAKLLLKVDDDVVLNTPRILRTVTFEYQSYWKLKMNEENDLILCRFMLHPQPVIRDHTSKWYVPFEQYSGEMYPAYCSGYAIFYSSSTVNKLYEAAQTLSYFWIDDVFITGIARDKAHVNGTKLNHMTVPEYDKVLKLLLQYKNREFIRSFVLSLNLDSNKIREVWKALLNATANLY